MSSFSRACTLWLSSVMGTRTVTVDDLASLEFVHHVFVELTPGTELHSFCASPSVSAGASAATDSGIAVVKSPDSNEHIYRVSERLGEQSSSLKKAMFFHISQGRARGAHPLVLQRLATIRRVVNLERLALFQDPVAAEEVLEFLFRSLTQIAWGNSAMECFENLHEYSREVIHMHMEARIKESYKEDFHLVQIEEMQRHLRMQMIHESKRMQDEMRVGEELVAEVVAKNARLCAYFDHVVASHSDSELSLLRWDLALLMRALGTMGN